MNPIPEKYLSKHLFLLIGMNPLPNLVATLLLAKPGATIWLLYSFEEGELSTKWAAETLEERLRRRRPDLTIHLEAVSSSNNLAIEDRVRKILKEGQVTGAVGLNYTGATKPMSVHTYRIIEQEFKEASLQPTFSYLDPRQLALRIDGRTTTEPILFNVIQNPSLRKRVEISLDELVKLHGYEPDYQQDWARAEETPGLFELCEAIHQLHLETKGISDWRDWLNREKLQTLPDPSHNPTFKPIREAIDNLCGGAARATPEHLAEILRPGYKKPGLPSCSKWFIGIWLEEYILGCFKDLKAQFYIKSCEGGVEYQDKEYGVKFEIDVAATIGYQLFAMSCMASAQRYKVKEHFLEIYVRARQLGGDEARIGLACYYPNAQQLEREIVRQLDTNKTIKVFGREELKNLKYHLATWLQTANQ